MPPILVGRIYSQFAELSSISTPFVYRPRSRPALPLPTSLMPNFTHPSAIVNEDWSLHETSMRAKSSRGEDINVKVRHMLVGIMMHDLRKYLTKRFSPRKAVPACVARVRNVRATSVSSLPHLLRFLSRCVPPSCSFIVSSALPTTLNRRGHANASSHTYETGCDTHHSPATDCRRRALDIEAQPLTSGK